MADLIRRGADRCGRIFDRGDLKGIRVFLLRLENKYNRQVNVVIPADDIGHVRIALGVRSRISQMDVEEYRVGPRFREHLDQLRIIGAIPRERAEHIQRCLVHLDDLDLSRRFPLLDRFPRRQVAECRFDEVERAARAEIRQKRPERGNDEPGGGRSQPFPYGHGFLRSPQ